ncbi:DUF2877 domain-containing protein [Budviciaceae bacterium BWR-B9]|uniref:DUF2877 domain-containing protein n=1 Tax=Limnobaculum allomyrinae TaxID=2791986 RepID=A0ABS1ILR8_9GAMM|nr:MULTISPECIES: DUF2877 domain-containing protein [Limnobaculum]MBK5142686.1 DUF2877 domain-containing protein [Limnobaculum allomyrinae]MBV7690428.1 DUF2877 domain-containing protein [Limnobaculum sp. M2-1]
MPRFTLAVSAFSPLQPDSLICHSRFSQAINLQNTRGELLTLHRYGQGISPMGWLLRTADFDQLHQQLKVGDLFTMRQQGLYTSDNLLISPQRSMALHLPILSSSVYSALSTLLLNTSHPTGLSGHLGQAISTASPLIFHFHQQLTNWFAGQQPQWQSIIGLGPGLTPSGDDMLVGAMAILHSIPTLRARLQQAPLINSSVKALCLLTTEVSACYLHHATLGHYSSSLTHLLHCLARSSPMTQLAVDRVLQHGHTSGADTLLGMHVALCWLKLNLQKDLPYARSGNTTNVY